MDIFGKNKLKIVKPYKILARENEWYSLAPPGHLLFRVRVANTDRFSWIYG